MVAGLVAAAFRGPEQLVHLAPGKVFTLASGTRQPPGVFPFPLPHHFVESLPLRMCPNPAPNGGLAFSSIDKMWHFVESEHGGARQENLVSGFAVGTTFP
jgi:hypothetical protein